MGRKEFSRMTEQRRVIIEELDKNRTHPTADEVFEKVRARLPRISLGTVYRNLETLADQGKVMKIEVPAGPMRFDARTEEHSHIRCKSCGRVDDIEVDNGEDLKKRVRPPLDYEVLECRLEVVGLCPRCRSENK
ncbi:MAG: transcriptional repressor [bacterium]